MPQPIALKRYCAICRKRTVFIGEKANRAPGVKVFRCRTGGCKIELPTVGLMRITK